MATQIKVNENIFVQPRKRLINWVRQQLIGPPEADGNGERTVLNTSPTVRYPCGAIYPISPAGDGFDPAGEDDDDEPLGLSAQENNREEKKEEPAVMRRYTPPSSLGFSVFIKGEEITLHVFCSAAKYEDSERNEKGEYISEWNHKSLGDNSTGSTHFINAACPNKSERQSHSALEGHARVDIEWRRFADGWIATVTLSNSKKLESKDKPNECALERARNTLFEASVRCRIITGEVGAYPHVDRSLLDDEEKEIELQYSRKQVYAIGHGCAAQWTAEDHKVREIYSDTMPAIEIPQMTADTGSRSDPILSLARLVQLTEQPREILSELNNFINGYSNWVKNQEHEIDEQEESDKKTARDIVDRMKMCLERMHTGLDLLKSNEQVQIAFAVANQAMLNQMQQNDLLRTKGSDIESYRWRPFQLAFILTTLESTADQNSEDRETVDLIWFPTGGGKTEAYLGLIAFQIVLRRLRNHDTGGGTVVLMRYTLRLLTRDQFIRATRLICSLELLRQDRRDLGKEPISIGLWIGGASSPNSIKKTVEAIVKAKEKNALPSLVLNQCPWCETKFKLENYSTSNSNFQFVCKSNNCSFGKTNSGILPCQVVDEALYRSPPTMLVATIDKFARFAWDERSHAFFGGNKSLPPELIIQDELHLISGALGSISGLYEAGLDTVIKLRGINPKYIASTATIRMAKQQIKKLYGRNLAVFPPPGLSCDDSFFATVTPLDQKPGRFYIGYLAPMLNRQQCMAPLAAALLLAPPQLFSEDEEIRELMDAWWTQVVYHGSLKGVSNSHTAFSVAVKDFQRMINPNSEIENREKLTIDQLTSLQTAEKNADIFSRLKSQLDEKGCLDAVLATNIISVGLDVGRLALMIINGQPLSTAEYIQASSRVGRSEIPGVVFINYYRDQARSLSHYESFRPYHEAFYRYVEPSSITPYTYQTRNRALHAALVIVIRHSVSEMLNNENPSQFNSNNLKIARAIEQLKRRCIQTSIDNAREVENHIDYLVSTWENEIERCRSISKKLEYTVSDQEKRSDRLLYNHTDQIPGLWPTLQSLRNVENSALLKVF